MSTLATRFFQRQLFLRQALKRGQQRRLSWRYHMTILVAVITLFTVTEAYAQFSQDFDLACRSIMTGGGGVTSGGNFAVIGALGLPMVPPADSASAPTYSVRSTNFGVRAGFLPGYPNGDAPVSAPPTIIEKDFVQRLPLLFKVAYIIRGC